MPSTDRLIEAAGGVLWRPVTGGAGLEIALVHRPKYDDWSLAKGKLETGEHPLLGAVREVREETGHIGVPGRRLGETRYLKDGEPKRVRYWAMSDEGGTFSPGAEVDQLMWLPPKEARRFLFQERDGRILADFMRDPEPTFPLVLVRHGSAGERASWQGVDRDRPLDELGQAQARWLVPILDAFRIRRVLSADVLRCLETVGPYAASRQLTVESEPLMSESGFAAHPEQAVNRLVALLSDPEPTVVCSQGKSLPDLLAGLHRRLGVPPPADTTLRKGGLTVLHVTDKGGTRLRGTDRFDPPATRPQT